MDRSTHSKVNKFKGRQDTTNTLSQSSKNKLGLSKKGSNAPRFMTKKEKEAKELAERKAREFKEKQ